jgi:hypothetical protein
MSAVTTAERPFHHNAFCDREQTGDALEGYLPDGTSHAILLKSRPSRKLEAERREENK